MIAEKTKEVLQKIKDEINNEYGFHDEIPRINYGPCGVFAQIFFKKWNELFKEKVHICFILTQSKDECDHVLIRLPSGELYDGGIGVHSDKQYKTKFLIEEMVIWASSYLSKILPRFDRKFVEKIVNSNLDYLSILLNNRHI